MSIVLQCTDSNMWCGPLPVLHWPRSTLGVGQVSLIMSTTMKLKTDDEVKQATGEAQTMIAAAK